MPRLVVCCCLFLFATCSFVSAQTTTGTWTLEPPQTQTAVNQVTVKGAINADGSSVWSATKGVVPAQFSLATGFTYGPVIFSSVQTTGTPPSFCYPTTPSSTCSALDFQPTSLTFDQLTTLSAQYTFTTGTCHVGALRWTIFFSDNSYIRIYYGKDSTFWTDCSSVASDSTIDQSGLNMINANFDGNASGGDVRYELSSAGGSYVNWATAQAFGGTKTITDIVLALDGGYAGDQVISPLGYVTVNDNTFQPQTGTSVAATCNLPPAYIEVDRLYPTPTGPIDETTVTGPSDNGSQFRIAGCDYMYNIAAKSLGPGQYAVKVIINGVPADGSAQFTLK